MNDPTEKNSTSPIEGHLGPNNAQSGPDYDPVNLMSQVFVDISTFLGPAQDVLLSWLLRLPQSRSPAKAAQSILAEIVEGQTTNPSEEGVKLIELLEQVADHNMENVRAVGLDRRRGGRSARVRD